MNATATTGQIHAGHIGDGEYRVECLFDQNSGQVATLTMRGDRGSVDAIELAKRWNQHADAVTVLRELVDKFSTHNPGGATRPQGEALAVARGFLAIVGGSLKVAKPDPLAARPGDTMKRRCPECSGVRWCPYCSPD